MPAAAPGVGETPVRGALAAVAGWHENASRCPLSPFAARTVFSHLRPWGAGTILLASSTGDPLAFPFGSGRLQAPLLAVLALAGAACFGGSRGEIAVPMASPLRADGSAVAVEAVRD